MVDGDGSYPAEGARRLLDEYVRAPGRHGHRSADGGRRRRCGVPPVPSVRRSRFRVGVPRRLPLRAGRSLLGPAAVLEALLQERADPVPRFRARAELTVQAVEKGFRLCGGRRSRSASALKARPPSSARCATGSGSCACCSCCLARLSAARLFRRRRAACSSWPAWLRDRCRSYEYYQTRLVGRFPLAILAAGLMNLSLFTLLTGVMLESGLRHRRESYQVALRNYKA